mgnify:CR=1 FL=1
MIMTHGNLVIGGVVIQGFNTDLVYILQASL